MRNRRNFYRILQVQPNACADVIRSSYRTLMRTLSVHPDLGGDDWNAATLNAAYATLSDPKKRVRYDAELLERYDIGALSGGGRRPAPGADSHYLSLRVQPDASKEVIEASYRSLKKSGEIPASRLEEAWAVLSDDKRRAAYDRGDPGPGPSSSALTYETTIDRFCSFCKTPHAVEPDADPGAFCVECESPLFVCHGELTQRARREVARFERDERLQYFTFWPGKVRDGRLVDLSPSGMRFTTRAALDSGNVIKIVGREFDAVGTVAHRRRGAETTIAGVRFLAIAFRRPTGNFVSVEI